MQTIINNQKLKFLKFNNAITINKNITKDMLTSQNNISINFDLSDLANYKFMCIYWRFHNFTSIIEGIGLKSSNTIDTNLRNANYFTLIQPYQHLPELINGDVNECDDIYMFSWSLHCTEIFNANTSYVKLNNLTISIFSRDEIELHSDTSIELVVQYQVNSNNLPQNLEILELDNLSMIFDNLPVSLQEIRLTRVFTETQIKNSLPKIPFGCKIIDYYNEHI
jgi:hypothetical protein